MEARPRPTSEIRGRAAIRRPGTSGDGGEIDTRRTTGRLGNTLGYNLSMSKVMVSLPDELLARIDREAKRRATSRSALLALAASRELERRDSEEIAQAITRSEKRFRSSGAFDAAELIRNERDSRP